MADLLTSAEVRAFLMDTPDVNVLLDANEFSDGYINLCIELAVEAYNQIPPRSAQTLQTFIGKAVLLWGTLAMMFDGRAAVAARNTMSYSDGGIQIPVEEKFELYGNLAASYLTKFREASIQMKINANIESGWGYVSGDQAAFPLW